LSGVSPETDTLVNSNRFWQDARRERIAAANCIGAGLYDYFIADFMSGGFQRSNGELPEITLARKKRLIFSVRFSW